MGLKVFVARLAVLGYLKKSEVSLCLNKKDHNNILPPSSSQGGKTIGWQFV